MRQTTWIRLGLAAGLLNLAGCVKHRNSTEHSAGRLQQTVGMRIENVNVPDDSLALAPRIHMPSGSWNREAYGHYEPTPFLQVWNNPLSTFSIDVDTASYGNIRRMIAREGRRAIPPGAIRIEELINYFRYTYPEPGLGHAVAVDVEPAACPWAPAHRLIRIGVQAQSLDREERPPSNLVFLIDTSGSMNSPDKLGLLKRACGLLIDQLDGRDRVAIVTYAGSAGLALPSTSGDNTGALKYAVDQLAAGGSTAGGAGIRLAYQMARQHRIPQGNNRVILATDGDFNVGTSSESELVDLIQREARSGVYLTVLGFGTGNYQDSRMESLSNHGNGVYAYIDGLDEARKVFLRDLMTSLYTVCKDVKIQAEFNPAFVDAYRLIGYENRRLADRDFADDRKDAGDVGSGHQVTVLYEVIPAKPEADPAAAEALRYQLPRKVVSRDELMQIRVRYELPDDEHSKLLTQQVLPPSGWTTGMAFSDASTDTRFAASVAAFGMVLRHSPFRGSADLDWSLETAANALGRDPHGYRTGFVDLAAKAKALREAPPPGIPSGPENAASPLPYRVTEGDTLEMIAKLFLVGPEELRVLNQLQPGARITPGQTLLIPPSDF